MLRSVTMVLVLLLAATARQGGATRVPGGTNPATDCLAEFDVPGELAAEVLGCTDCDPTCDRDGAAGPNGSCTFAVSLCLNQSAPGCASVALASVRVRPESALIVPTLDSTQCGAPSGTVVPTRGRKPGKKRIRVRALASTMPVLRDRNTLRLLCRARPKGEKCPTTEARETCADHNPLRNLYFGDLHVHTTQSFDAHAFDVKTTPLQAYAFARGEAVSLPPLDPAGGGTQTVRLERPLDFAAVTDHSEFLGEVETCTTPGAAGYDSPTCQAYRTEPPNLAVTIFGVRFTPPAPTRFPDLCQDGCPAVASAVWQRTLDAAEGAYDRTSACRFTSFPAYEYTAATGASTLHRNVIFRNERVPFPTTYFEQPTPRGLWIELKASCLDAPFGCDVLAIPHNSNESNGKMFLVEYPGATSLEDERAQAAFRAQMEPLVEIYQHKGDSECQNGLSGTLGAPDELCEFEKEPRTPFVDCGDGTGGGGSARVGCYSRLDFVRGALLAGLGEEQRLGVNPYRLGIIASTDTHNGTPGFTDEQTFIGHRGTDDDTPDKRLGRGVLTVGGISFSPGGLVAAWAEENSRASLFEALRRREVYGTSGPRIAVRVFGGWNLPPNLCADPDLVAEGYGLGVPMGALLPTPPAGATAPSFVVSALRDPGTVMRPGVPLERVQVVKGWIAGGEAHQQVYDVAGEASGATVDTGTCLPTGRGSDALCTVWTDPSFDPALRAVYYVRVLENPTCRWSTLQCNALPPAARPASCNDPTWPKTIQERAWSSPIWYTPPG